MELREFIKTTIREYLNEQENINKLFINEVAHENNINDLIKQKQIPLTPTIVSKIIGNKFINAFHVTGVENINQIKKIINKRNQISSFNYFNKNKNLSDFSPFTSGNILFKLKGKLNIISSKDLWSSVDNSLNRRWIDSSYISKNLNDEILKNFNFFEIKGENNYNKLKRYVKFIYEYLDKNKLEINKNLINLIIDQYAQTHYNETVVSNITVEKVAFIPSIVFYECDDDKDGIPCKNKIISLIEELKTFVSNDKIFILKDESELRKWFLDNGGEEDIENFRKKY